jgi:hypothetical protein
MRNSGLKEMFEGCKALKINDIKQKDFRFRQQAFIDLMKN